MEILLTGGYNVCAIPLVQRKKVFPKSSPVKAIACADCGAVFGLKLEKPEKMRPFVTY